MRIGSSVYDALNKRRATLAGRPFIYLFIYLSAGRGVIPQKLLGETPKAFGECPAVIRL